MGPSLLTCGLYQVVSYLLCFPAAVKLALVACACKPAGGSVKKFQVEEAKNFPRCSIGVSFPLDTCCLGRPANMLNFKLTFSRWKKKRVWRCNKKTTLLQKAWCLSTGKLDDRKSKIDITPICRFLLRKIYHQDCFSPITYTYLITS